MQRVLTSFTFVTLILIAPFAFSQGFPPEEALRRMKVADGFEVKLFASEPNIRQPVSMTFDERGRMWIVQYIQYPTPKGLEPVEVDRYLRTKYDKIPEPPPKGPKGADKITIAEDTDGDGRADTFKEFVSELNLASGLEVGYGGVFILQTPYLLFYPDRNHDDVPDGDPEVLLTGFGMEDAHAVANSLTWGPDGWLYGAQGSTCTAHIRGLTFQQGIWRYHPVTREFELFSEGGGNTWGLDFDAHGNIIAGTNWGGVAALHQVQGAYYIKAFAKHGELQNSNAYGYLDHIPYEKFIGGHVTAGGIVYQGGAFPEKFNNVYIAGNLLSNQVHWHTLEREGSSFKMKLGGVLLDANDTWFRPVDCALGPDGSVFVADWYDQRATHVDPKDDWDRSNGRIYKIAARGAPAVKPRDLSRLLSDELVDLLPDRNQYNRRVVRRLLAERRDASVLARLLTLAFSGFGDHALDAFWELNASGGFDAAAAAKGMMVQNEDIRAWTIRLLGDPRKINPALEPLLIERAQRDGSPAVRNQLACTAKRLPAAQALSIIRELALRSEDASDPQIPLLIWWALEDKAVSDREDVLKLFASPEMWKSPIGERYLIERLGRRYAAEGTPSGYEADARLLASAPSQHEKDLLIQGMDKGFEGRQVAEVPRELQASLAELWKAGDAKPALIRLGLRLGSAEAREAALREIADAKVHEADRLAIIEALGQAGPAECEPALLKLVEGNEKSSIRKAAFGALQRFDSPEIANAVLAGYAKMPGDVRVRARGLLTSRAPWAIALLQSVDAGTIDAKEISEDDLRHIALHGGEPIQKLIQKHWGKIGRQTDGQKSARIGGIVSILGLGHGDPKRGRELFQQSCGVCHKLFGEGKEIGPDLTGADRKNRDFLLTNIVDPSAMIRKEYINYIVEAKDGRMLIGLLAESTPATVTVLDAKDERTTLSMSEVKEIRQSEVSLMPEEILDALDEQQVRDLFSYLQSDSPPPS